jgi:hypothetical protein
MRFCDHRWIESGDTVRQCLYCGELQFGTGKPWSFETVVKGNNRLSSCADEPVKKKKVK